MKNAIFIEAYTQSKDFRQSLSLKLPLESFVAYCVYVCCCPENVELYFVSVDDTTTKTLLNLNVTTSAKFCDSNVIPWQVSSCLCPVIISDDTIITGLCAVARHLCYHRSSHRIPQEHEQGLLGFRNGCLQAPNEVSIWTKFCEVDIVKTVNYMYSLDDISEIPKNLVRFENHLHKPVRVHNVFKLARELKKISLNSNGNNESVIFNEVEIKSRTPKARKWKSNVKKNLEANCSIKIEDLDITHQFAEGPFLTLADLILLPSYYIIVQKFSETALERFMPLTYKWYQNIIKVKELESLYGVVRNLAVTPASLNPNIFMPILENVSLYKCDPKRHNPKRRLFTKEEDIENALANLKDGMELNVMQNALKSYIKWDDIPDGANPTAGHLPDDRMLRKSQQLENLALAVLDIAKEGDLIVDFCSGSGHLGILVAHLLPKCTVILLENKEQSLLRARERVHSMGLKNIYFFQCNLDFYIGKFDIGIALHACGIASDLVLDKCLKANAKFILCPCCYGSLHVTDRLSYPRSNQFRNMSVGQYMCIGHAADQTHELHPLRVRGDRCMAAIDSDRGHLAQEFGYKVTLSRLKPLTCTPKNNLLIGVPV